MQRLTLNNLDGMTGLAGLADRTGVDIKPTLLRVLTDLYIQKASHTPHEDQHFTELALRLIDSVDEATRAAVAARLTKYPGTPRPVIDRLMQLGPRTADPSQQGSIELFAEAAPANDIELFEPVTPRVTQPVRPHHNPSAAAPAAPLTVDYVSQRETFFTAPRDERKLILMNLEHVADQNVALAQETNIIRYLEQAALAGRAQEFTTLLQQGLGLSRITARRVVTDRGGEPFVVCAKALAMPTDVFQRILMSLNPVIGQSVEMVFELSDLFLTLPLSSALHLVAIWRAADRIEAKSPAHRRAHWDDDIPARRPAVAEPFRTEQPAPLALQRREGSRR
ncbi:MAG: DUF2336 domain-containing protein [Pseudomonadota bacterium]